MIIAVNVTGNYLMIVFERKKREAEMKVLLRCDL